MSTGLRRYVLAFLAVVLTGAVRFSLMPILGNRFGFDLFLISSFICGRYLGFGPSLFALFLGAVPVSMVHFLGSDLQDPFFPVGLGVYVGLGAIVVLLCKSEHDARLALQNEVSERKAAECAVRASEAQLQEREERIRLAIESANIGTWDWNPVTDERRWSDRTKAMWGLSADVDANDVSFLDPLPAEDRERAEAAVQKALDPKGDGAYDIDYRVIWPDGTVHWYIAKGQALFEGEGPERRATRFIGTVLDITERKHAEAKVRASEARLQAIMDNTSAVIYLKDLQGRFLMINSAFLEFSQLAQDQIVGKTDDDIFPSEVVAKLQANDRQIRDTGRPLEFEEVVPHRDGLHTYVSVKFPIFDAAGNVAAVGGISTDITDRKKATDALEIEQEVLRHTIEVQDHERQLVAYELHDGMVQLATGALMQLEGIQHQLNSEAISEQIKHVVNILRKTVDAGRRIINGIHTTILVDCGVVAAIQELIADEDPAKLQIEFIKDDDLDRMATNIELALFHITQEALTNIRKHSQSTKVRIQLSRRGDRVHLEIRDWGIGFTPPARPKGLHGLRIMTERARIAGGTCTVRNAADKGAIVVVDLPYQVRDR